MAFKYCHGDLLKFISYITIENKDDLSDLKYWCQTSISRTDLLVFSCTTISRVYREWDFFLFLLMSGNSVGRNPLLMKDQRGLARLVQVDKKVTVSEITTLYNGGIQKSISECICRTLKQMAYSCREPPGCNSCQMTRNWWYNLRITQIGQQKIGIVLPSLTSSDFCCNVQIVGPKLSISNMKLYIHPTLYQLFKVVV